MKKFLTVATKGLAGLLLGIVMFCGLTVPVLAAGDVPELVMDARNGVVRIMVGVDNIPYAFGTGFIVGTEDEYYVVTNHHVIEDIDQIWIYYDTGKYVEATIYEDSPRRDLCILKPKRKIPDAKILPLETEDFDSGSAVYALGYPGAADKLTGDFYNYEELADIVADKSSMTITDGIISSIRTANTVGDASHKVQIIQTNTAINGGNSGGPLLDKEGNVVGVNTFGVVADGTSGINGCVHVSELIAVLRSRKIEYFTANEARLLREGGGSNNTVIIIVGIAVILAAGVVLLLIMRSRKQKAAQRQQVIAHQQAAAHMQQMHYPQQMQQPTQQQYYQHNQPQAPYGQQPNQHNPYNNGHGGGY